MRQKPSVKLPDRLLYFLLNEGISTKEIIEMNIFYYSPSPSFGNKIIERVRFLFTGKLNHGYAFGFNDRYLYRDRLNGSLSYKHPIYYYIEEAQDGWVLVFESADRKIHEEYYTYASKEDVIDDIALLLYYTKLKIKKGKIGDDAL